MYGQEEEQGCSSSGVLGRESSPLSSSLLLSPYPPLVRGLSAEAHVDAPNWLLPLPCHLYTVEAAFLACRQEFVGNQDSPDKEKLKDQNCLRQKKNK